MSSGIFNNDSIILANITPKIDSDLLPPLNFQLIDYDDQIVRTLRSSIACFNISETNQTILKISYLQSCFPIISGFIF